MNSEEAMEPVPGSGNVFRDYGYLDAEVRQAKATTLMFEVAPDFVE